MSETTLRSHAVGCGVALVALVAAISAARAQPTRSGDTVSAGAQCTDGISARYTAAYTDCLKKAHSTIAHLYCIRDERARQDAALAAAFASKLATLRPQDAARLQKVEQTWQAYRDSWCPAHAGPQWGSLSAMGSANCLLDETIRHTIGVETYPRDSVIVPCAGAQP